MNFPTLVDSPLQVRCNATNYNFCWCMVSNLRWALHKSFTVVQIEMWVRKRNQGHFWEREFCQMSCQGPLKVPKKSSQQVQLKVTVNCCDQVMQHPQVPPKDLQIKNCKDLSFAQFDLFHSIKEDISMWKLLWDEDKC